MRGRRTLLSQAYARLRLGVSLRPLSYIWGADRGLSIHRFYVEEFLLQHSVEIHGHCLEFESDTYTSRFGRGGVTALDIIDLDNENPNATIVADLTKNNGIPSCKFDCIICTHVLHVVFDLRKIVSELYRILKPGGILLIAVPQVSMCDTKFRELWRFTAEGLQTLLTEVFDPRNVAVWTFGNALTTTGDFRGLVVGEFSRKELSYHDPRFGLEVCAWAKK